MLIIECEEHHKKVLEFAKSVGASQQLQDKLNYLATYGDPDHPDSGFSKCELYYDFAPYSYRFLMYFRNPKTSEYYPIMNGGLIYSGPGVPSDGSGPSFTVDLRYDESQGLTHRWSVHT